MKKELLKSVLSTFILVIMLTGCQQGNATNIEDPSVNEITTYEEIIEDGKVEIDGISYDIKSERKTTNTYDDNGNLIEALTTDHDTEMRSEIVYDNDRIIENKVYANDELQATIYFHYEDDFLVEKMTVHKDGLETRIEYSLDDHKEIRTHYGPDGNVASVITISMDDDKILETISTTPTGEVVNTSTYFYDTDLLTKIVSVKGDPSTGIKTESNLEHNNVGDKIMEYNITFMEEENLLIAKFYDIEYNETLLPLVVTEHRVQSIIEKENIRDY